MPMANIRMKKGFMEHPPYTPHSSHTMLLSSRNIKQDLATGEGLDFRNIW